MIKNSKGEKRKSLPYCCSPVPLHTGNYFVFLVSSKHFLSAIFSTPPLPPNKKP